MQLVEKEIIIRSLETGTQKQESETRSPETEAMNQEPGTRNPEVHYCE